MTEKKTEDHVIMLKNVRAAFPHYFTPSQVKGEGKAAFSGSFIMPPDHPDVITVQQGIAKVANAKWGDKGQEILKALIAGDKVCLHNGNTKADLTGYTGNLFVSARSPSRPLVIGADKAILSEEDGKPYSGCYVNVQIALWAQANNYGKRVNAQLRGVQFLRDGESFGGGVPSTPDEFEDIAGDEADADAPVVDTGDWGDLVA